MATNVQRREFTAPPPLDESYWAALLQEGEFTETVQIEREEIHEPEHIESHVNGSAAHSSVSQEGSGDQDWVEMQQIMDSDTTVELTATGCNRGGLLVEWRSLHGFVPASQLVDFPATPQAQVRRAALTARIGQPLLLRVIELNREQNRLILSERAAQAQPGERADILTRLKSGDTVTGSVTNLTDFGAFLDLGGLEGLIHISELSWGRVGHPSDTLQRGQQVEAYVLEVNRSAGRVALSLKRLHPDPWATVQERYKIGEMVEGVITNVVDFGAFARLEEGLEGLIHVSELAEGHFLHPRNVVNEGQHITARILSIDGQARRLGLSLRAME
jgi:small subunit ribosomal protein S1